MDLESAKKEIEELCKKLYEKDKTIEMEAFHCNSLTREISDLKKKYESDYSNNLVSCEYALNDVMAMYNSLKEKCYCKQKKDLL